MHRWAIHHGSHPDRARPRGVGHHVQSIGRDNNRKVFYDMFDSWAETLKPLRPELSAADWLSFRSNMYDGEKFLFNVDEDFVSACTTPMLVLMGRDIYHPEVSSRELARLAPNATLIEEWMDGAPREAAMEQVADFLATNTPA